MRKRWQSLRSLAATVDVLSDPTLMVDLRTSDQELDRDAQPYEEIRRKLGLSRQADSERGEAAGA